MRTPLRAVVLGATIVTGLGVVYSLVGAISGWEPAAGPLLQALLHLAAGALVVTAAAQGSGGRGWAARLGFGAGALGLALLVVAELTYPAAPAVADGLFGIASPLAGLGLVVAGVAVLRRRRWRGGWRAVPLVSGLWVFLVTTPALVVTGGPPAPAALLAIAGSELCWTLLGLAVLREAATPGTRADPRTRVVA